MYFSLTVKTILDPLNNILNNNVELTSVRKSAHVRKACLDFL